MLLFILNTLIKYEIKQPSEAGLTHLLPQKEDEDNHSVKTENLTKN